MSGYALAGSKSTLCCRLHVRVYVYLCPLRYRSKLLLILLLSFSSSSPVVKFFFSEFNPSSLLDWFILIVKFFFTLRSFSTS